MKALGIGILLVVLSKYLDVLGFIGAMLILGGGGVIWYYEYERKRKTDKIRNYYGLFFHCTSGKYDVLWFDHHKDVVDLFDRITNSMNHRDKPNFVAHFTDNRIVIKDSENVIVNSEIDAGGNMVVGNNSK